MKYTKALILTVAAIGLSACSSSVKKVESVNGQQVQAADMKLEHGIGTVTLKLNEDAKAKLADNLKFNPEQLRSTIVRGLEAKEYIRPNGANTVEIVVTDIRTRSNFSAVAFGFMAGSDRINGTVTVYNELGKPVKSFNVETSYALGGLAGGMDESRMSWLYEEFAQNVMNELGKTTTASN